MIVWQASVSDYLIQAAILLQPLFWMWLYDSRLYLEWVEHIFYAIGVLSIVVIDILSISVGYYKTHILIEYVGMTIFAAVLYSDNNRFKEALCLAFLTVYLNSYYWEIPFHFMEYRMLNIRPDSFVQLARLLPLMFFWRKYRFNKHSLDLALLGVLFSTAFLFMRAYVFNYRYGMRIPYAINRIICVYILINIIMGADKKEDMNVKH